MLTRRIIGLKFVLEYWSTSIIYWGAPLGDRSVLKWRWFGRPLISVDSVEARKPPPQSRQGKLPLWRLHSGDIWVGSDEVDFLESLDAVRRRCSGGRSTPGRKKQNHRHLLSVLESCLAPLSLSFACSSVIVSLWINLFLGVLKSEWSWKIRKHTN